VDADDEIAEDDEITEDQETYETQGGSLLTVIPSSTMRLERNIIYVDIKDDFLFVGYAEKGIDVFNIKNSDDIKKVGRIDHSY
jgi:hypothetical protein